MPFISELSWNNILDEEFNKTYFKNIIEFLNSEEKNGKVIYPNKNEIFNAFELTPFSKVQVLILGQDPYHGENQAHGLCFSVQNGVKIPPSLQNIFKEIKADLGKEIPQNGNLSDWAAQGVFLLNSFLTVEANKPLSHKKIGWDIFTDSVIKILSEKKESMIFILWGKFAHEKEKLIDSSKHPILKSAHPSPLSAYQGFFGCKHFSKTNEILKSLGKQQINF